VADRPQILVVDDDEDCRTVLKDLLELNGYAVQSCGEARVAVDLARRAPPPALMLLDYRLPDVDGVWVVERLRELGIALPVLFTSGSEEGCAAAGRLGLRSLGKPLDADKLLAEVASLVRGA
jgi:two-component system response regulator AtoC